jgi:hypothetical protein
MARTIQQAVDASGEQVKPDERVNFGSCPRDCVKPNRQPNGVMRSFWFKFDDICDMPLSEVRGAIGPLAPGGELGAAKYMRVSELPADKFTLHSEPQPGVTPPLFDLKEFRIEVPVKVRCTIYVG